MYPHKPPGVSCMTLTAVKGSMMKHGMNQDECETEGLFMIIAGTESTASAIRSSLIHTITSPLVYQKLKQEIKTAVQEGRVSSPISAAEAKKLPYLQVSSLPTSSTQHKRYLTMNHRPSYTKVSACVLPSLASSLNPCPREARTFSATTFPKARPLG